MRRGLAVLAALRSVCRPWFAFRAFWRFREHGHSLIQDLLQLFEPTLKVLLLSHVQADGLLKV
jgi:hypothetical protein